MTIVRGGTIVTMDGTRRVIEDGAVVIRRSHQGCGSGRTGVTYTAPILGRLQGRHPRSQHGHTHFPMTAFPVSQMILTCRLAAEIHLPAEAKTHEELCA